jgi:hypothetical protein
MNTKTLRVVLTALVLAAVGTRPTAASPTMIRLGYRDCATCHASPQGGGLLTTYGKGIDRAQSLRANEFVPMDATERRFLYDVRLVASNAFADALRSPSAVSRTAGFRLMLRSAVRLGDRQRMSYSLGVETPASSPSGPRGSNGDAAFVIAKALWEGRVADGLDLAIGRDEMPSGIGLPDPLTFMRRGNDAGNTAYPLQVKAFWSRHRVQLTPYVFGPGGDEPAALRQYGIGIVSGVDVWRERAVVGLTGRTSRGRDFERRSIGAYARLGFGKWGVLAEHDLTSRTDTTGAEPRSQYVAGHTQVFFEPREWLVTSLGTEHLVVNGPGVRHVFRLAPAVQTRLTDSLTVIFTVRDVFTGVDAGRSRTYSMQVAVKTVE